MFLHSELLPPVIQGCRSKGFLEHLVVIEDIAAHLRYLFLVGFDWMASDFLFPFFGLGNSCPFTPSTRSENHKIISIDKASAWSAAIFRILCRHIILVFEHYSSANLERYF